jgi:hypothetical protein
MRAAPRLQARARCGAARRRFVALKAAAARVQTMARAGTYLPYTNFLLILFSGLLIVSLIGDHKA